MTIKKMWLTIVGYAVVSLLIYLLIGTIYKSGRSEDPDFQNQNNSRVFLTPEN